MVNAFLFLRRIRHCAGFGVQSPTDYAFVRGVIYERLPYYAYDELAVSYPEADSRTMWIARLLHRVSNHAQAENIIYCANEIPDVYASAMQKGCLKSAISGCSSIEKLDICAAEDGAWIIIPDIYKGNKLLWEHLKTLDNIVAFDLYHLAIAFVDKKRYSEAHLINPY